MYTYQSNRVILKIVLDHWNKMITWVETQPKDFKAIDMIMYKAIKTDWYGKNCILCKKFKKLTGCKTICPVIKEYGGCGSLGWTEVNEAKTWEQWLIAAKKLVKKIEYLIEKNIKSYGNNHNFKAKDNT